mgnify:CR=1 FL=1
MSNYILFVNFLRGSLCVDSSIRVSRITIRSPLAVAVAFHDLFEAGELLQSYNDSLA